MDLANTVAIERGVERDLLAPDGAFDRWAAAEGDALDLGPIDRTVLRDAQPALIALRGPVRDVLAALAARRTLPAAAVQALNAASRAAPEWVELDPRAGRVVTRQRGSRGDRLLAAYARSALHMAERTAADPIRVCGAPSCGMFYRPSRSRQVWCSTQCGTRARVARAYRSRGAARRDSADLAQRIAATPLTPR